MSKRKDRERAVRGEQYRHGNLVHAVPGEKIPSRRIDSNVLICGKCRQAFTRDMASEHLKKCQPNGAICPKCGKKFLPHEFLVHFIKCMGGIQGVEHAD